MACSTEALERAVDQFQSGDDQEAAFRLIFTCYFPVFQRFFSRRGVPSEDGYDLSQVTLLQVFKNLGDFRRESSFKTWISTIAFNGFNRWLRQKRKRSLEVPLASSDSLDREPPEPEDPGPSQESEAVEAERRERLRQCLLDLSARQRLCFVLYTYDELSYREIAERMNIEVGTVGALLNQARNKVRDYFGEELN
jgi:RNA polymerase sigma-70 factor (ECF subfamily)